MMSDRRTRIKICGITSIEMARAAVDAGADAIGLMFVPDSPRHVLPGTAQQISRSLPPLVSAVGVFANPNDPDLQNWRGQWVQLHGDESEAQLARVAQSKRIIKGMRFDRDQILRWDRCPHASALLIDGSSGGRGRSFDHDALADLMPALNTPVIIAGGLTAENVGDAIHAARPYGVDVSTGVERARGEKDPVLIRAFCAAVREADAAMARRNQREDRQPAVVVPPRNAEGVALSHLDRPRGFE